jgi:glyoxylate reductase
MSDPSSPPSGTPAAVGADVVVTLLHDRVDATLLDAAGPQLRGIANVAAGYTTSTSRRRRDAVWS